MQTQGLNQQRHDTGIPVYVARAAEKIARIWRPRDLWARVVRNRHGIVKAEDLPDHLRRDLGFPQHRQIPPSAQQTLGFYL